MFQSVLGLPLLLLGGGYIYICIRIHFGSRYRLMPHRRSRKNFNGVPNVKLSSNHVRVSPASVEILPSVVVAPDAYDPDAISPDITGSSTFALVDKSCSCYVDYALSVSTNNDHACSSLCAWTAPDMNPVFDCFDQLDSMLANLSFKVAADLAPSTNSMCVATSPCSGHVITTASISSQDVLSECDASSVHLGALDSLASQPSHDCLHIQKLLVKLLQCYWRFEVHLLDEVDVVNYYADSRGWSLDFIKSCLVEYEIFLEHFSKSAVPRILEVHCHDFTQV
jgi:hypothetical protein